MVDREVEEVLEEIRIRVRAGSDALGEATPTFPVASELGPARTAIITNGFSGLTVLARAADRLPPLMSNRTGVSAKLELWVKRLLKRATHWFTWEQVNFNIATHQTLRELIETIAVFERRVLALETLVQQQQAILQTQSEAREDLSAKLDHLRTQFAFLDAQTNEIQARIAGLTTELRERDERLLDEQRVCFKQISLEADETNRDLKARMALLEAKKP